MIFDDPVRKAYRRLEPLLNDSTKRKQVQGAVEGLSASQVLGVLAKVRRYIDEQKKDVGGGSYGNEDSCNGRVHEKTRGARGAERIAGYLVDILDDKSRMFG